jgi:predicted regulator of Ras-like GTPase activity (Roadblock/LC7/MglB family)
MAFEQALRELKAAGTVAAAIVSRDGTVLGADLPPEVGKETFSIMCATIHGAGMTVSTELRRTNPRRIVLDSAEGRVIIAEAGRRVLVVLVLPQGADVDQVVEAARPIMEKIGRETG